MTPARRLAVGKGKPLPADGAPSGRALQTHVSFTVMHSYLRVDCEEAEGRRGNPYPQSDESGINLQITAFIEHKTVKMTIL